MFALSDGDVSTPAADYLDGMGKVKQAIVGLALGVGGVGVVAAMTTVAMKMETPKPVRTRCYDVATVHLEIGVAVIFNACTGAFSLSQFPADIRPIPKLGRFTGPKQRV